MKKRFSFQICVLCFLCVIYVFCGCAQNQERDRLRAVVEANPNDLKAHEAFLSTFDEANEAQGLYEQWMKKYPDAAAIPQALGEKYGTYSPKAAQYLLKAAEIQPNNVEIWQKLATDASFRGDKTQEQIYMKKAIAADPENLNLQMRYVFLFNEDKAVYKEKMLEFVEQHPTDEATITLLHIYGTEMKEIGERIQVWERLRTLFPQSESVSFKVAMSRLADAYLQDGRYENVIELCQTFQDKAPERLRFSEKLRLAEILTNVDCSIKAGEFASVKDQVLTLNSHPGHLFDFGNKVILAKAKVLAGMDAVEAAYDSLISFQSQTPDTEVKRVVEDYGYQLGKRKTQVSDDIRQAIARRSRLAPAFELESYLSDKKIKLTELKGKVILLSFWYPGCGPCRGEMPHIESAVKDFDKSELVYLGVNGLRDQDEFVLPFMKGTGYSFTPLAADERVVKDYGVRAYPSNFIIDQDGRIAYSGFMIHANSEDMLEMMIQSLL